MTRRHLITIAAGSTVAALVLAWPASAEGPWTLQIVDAETARPLEGAVVLAVWHEKSAAWPHPEWKYHDVDETVSDATGHVTIPARDLSGNSGLRAIVGPRLEIFKTGYGNWRFENDVMPPHSSSEEMRQYDRERWERAARAGLVIGLAPAKTKPERLRVLPSCHPDHRIPIERIPRWVAACDAERVAHGLRPTHPELTR